MDDEGRSLKGERSLGRKIKEEKEGKKGTGVARNRYTLDYKVQVCGGSGGRGGAALQQQVGGKIQEGTDIKCKMKRRRRRRRRRRRKGKERKEKRRKKRK